MAEEADDPQHPPGADAGPRAARRGAGDELRRGRPAATTRPRRCARPSAACSAPSRRACDGCPVAIDIPGFIRRIGDKDFRGAYDVIARPTCCPRSAAASAPRRPSARASAPSGDTSSRWPSAGWSASSATWRSRTAGPTAPYIEPTPLQGRHRRLGPGRAWPAPPTWPRPAARSRCSRRCTARAACCATASPTSACPTTVIDAEIDNLEKLGVTFRVQHRRRPAVHASSR